MIHLGMTPLVQNGEPFISYVTNHEPPMVAQGKTYIAFGAHTTSI